MASITNCRLVLAVRSRQEQFQILTPEPRAMYLLSLQDGKSGELLRVTPDLQIRQGTVNFLSDSQQIIFFGRVKGVSGIWRMPVHGGELSKLDRDVQDIGFLKLNHQTGLMAFGPSGGPRYEVWKMENFLPSKPVER